jgi:hypothetical protein
MDRRTKATLTTIALIALIAASIILFNHLANGYATAATTTPRPSLQGEKVYRNGPFIPRLKTGG